jgi:hypothetical protein
LGPPEPSVIFVFSPSRTMENGGGNGRRRTTHREKTSKRKTKKLGYVAQASISHNDALVEKFIEDLKAGRPVSYEVAVVEANPSGAHPGRVEFGGGVFSVRVGGVYHQASLRGLLKGRGRFHHNPDVITAVKDGRHVLVEDLGLGERSGTGVTHQIMGVMMYDQYLRALEALGKGKRTSSRRSSSGGNGMGKGFMFNRTATRYAAENRRENVKASLNLIKTRNRRHATAAAAGGAGRGATLEEI